MLCNGFSSRAVTFPNASRKFTATVFFVNTCKDFETPHSTREQVGGLEAAERAAVAARFMMSFMKFLVLLISCLVSASNQAPRGTSGETNSGNPSCCTLTHK